MTYDLVLTGGHLLDPAQGLDKIADIAFSNGKVAAVADRIDTSAAASVNDVSGYYVSPGFIDLHTHVYWGGTSLGIDPGLAARRGGVTTLVDAGSAGPGNFAGFQKHVIEPSEVRILAYLHVSFAGIFAFSRNIMVGESSDLRLISPIDAVEVANKYRQSIVGIKVRVGRFASGDSGIVPLDIALQVAEQLDLPIMAHIDEPPPSYDAVVDRLRPGDTLTHCFRPFPNSPALPDGSVRGAVLAARDRGVLFDIGHGMGSFSYKTARAMLDAGFAPDSISSDIHDLNVNGPVFDQAVTLSKFLALGLPLSDVVRMTTSNAAAAIRRPQLGTFAIGAVGDATIFAVDDAQHTYTDSGGAAFRGPGRITCAATVHGGSYRLQ